MATNPLFTVTFDVKSSDNYGDLRTELRSVGKEQASIKKKTTATSSPASATGSATRSTSHTTAPSIKKKNYGDFIACLRHRLSNPKHFSHNCPVLPPVEPNVPPEPPRRWFHVVLETQTSALTLATRADNLYLEGFRSSDGTWWELTRGLIPGATYVGFGGTYPDLLGDTDKLVDVALGPQQMTEAVNVLAARTRADLASGPKLQRASKDALVALLLMVHEATRFQTVSKKVSDLMHPKAAMKSGKITSQMKKQVNGWQDLSTALLKTDARPPGQFTPFKDMDVMTAEKAAETVGILLFVEVPGGMTAATALQLFRES